MIADEIGLKILEIGNIDDVSKSDTEFKLAFIENDVEERKHQTKRLKREKEI